MVGIQELFRTAVFGLAPKWVSQGHALAFGLMVVLTILYLSNGLVGDWPKIKKIFFRKPSREVS
jgi:branched-chain amino acid transport system permease protein